MGDGDDALDLLSGSTIAGIVDGGAGADTVSLGGTGTGSFAGAVNVERLAVNGGTWTLTAVSTYSSGTSIATPATLIGTTATLTGAIINSGRLVIDQNIDGAFAATLGGTGQLVKSGTGAVTIGTQSVRRSVGFAGFADALTTRYDGNVLHGFAEAGIALSVVKGRIEPFAGAMAFRVHSDGFTEAGGSAALAGASRSETFTLSNVGLRASTPIVAGVSARGSASWQRVLGDARPEASLRFAGGTVPFLVTGTALSRDAAALSLDLAWTPRSNMTLSVGYAGTIGQRGDDTSLRAGFSLRVLKRGRSDAEGDRANCHAV